MSIFESFRPSAAQFEREYYDSQTEAAWAAYFRMHRVEFVHEPATYMLPHGELYTPDFYLTEMNAFIEVKNGNADNLAAYKISQLACATGRQGFIVQGKPHYASVYAYTPEWTFKPSRTHEPPYDRRHSRIRQILDKDEAWMPDRDTDSRLFEFAIKAAKRANEVCVRRPTADMAEAHTQKKKRMRLPENLIDLTGVTMPPGSMHRFYYPD